MSRPHPQLAPLLAVLALSALGCASGGGSAPRGLRLRLVDERPVFEPGSRQTVVAHLENHGRQPLRIGEGQLQVSVMCRTRESGGEWGIGGVSGWTGSIWGGVTDSRPPADDPLWCRQYPPDSWTLQPGESKELATDVETPAECVGSEGELEVYFEASDDGRHCPGIWFGRTGKSTRRVSLRQPAATAAAD